MSSKTSDRNEPELTQTQRLCKEYSKKNKEVRKNTRRDKRKFSKTESLHTTFKSTGLEINIEKTKTMRVNVNQEASILVGRQVLEDVDKFTCLGSIVS